MNDVTAFWQRVDRRGENDCWLWQGRKTKGYGQVYFRGQHVQAHRLAYQLLAGPIPDGLTLDHLCTVKDCVNPNHLEPVSIRDNKLRGIISAGRDRYCSKGHEMTLGNTRIVITKTRRYRVCITCDRKYKREWLRAKTSSSRQTQDEGVEEDAGGGAHLGTPPALGATA